MSSYCQYKTKPQVIRNAINIPQFFIFHADRDIGLLEVKGHHIVYNSM